VLISKPAKNHYKKTEVFECVLGAVGGVRTRSRMLLYCIGSIEHRVFVVNVGTDNNIIKRTMI
jgi:hypothetical protein